MIGVCDLQIFREAAASPEGFIAVDFAPQRATNFEPTPVSCCSSRPARSDVTPV
jgi:hypothetical protein